MNAALFNTVFFFPNQQILFRQDSWKSIFGARVLCLFHLGIRTMHIDLAGNKGKWIKLPLREGKYNLKNTTVVLQREDFLCHDQQLKSQTLFSL